MEKLTKGGGGVKVTLPFCKFFHFKVLSKLNYSYIHKNGEDLIIKGTRAFEN